MRQIYPGESATRPLANSFWRVSLPIRHHRTRTGDRRLHESAAPGGFLAEPVPLPVPGTCPGMPKNGEDFPSIVGLC